MTGKIKTFKEITAEERPSAGGKGGALARLYQARYPVPDGFVILPSAFAGEELTPEAWGQVRTHLERLRGGNRQTAFAVRSSALSEDSAQASFAGEFETVLDVHTDQAIREAIRTVHQSRHSERVRAYSEAKGIDAIHEIAVVVQQLVRADISGVLFTADPVTGDRSLMTGNYIHGLGDALVSGEAEPFTFTLERPKGAYDGPPELRRYARKLYRMAGRLQKDMGGPQDIEWCVAGDRLYLLQSRPITTLIGLNPVTGVRNDSLTGDYLWSNQISAEVFCAVMAPGTRSVWEIIFERMGIGEYSGIGIIGGRVYTNMSAVYSLMTKFMGPDKILEYMDSLGGVPEHVEIPTIPMTFKTVLTDVVLPQIPIELNKQRLEKKRAEFVGQAPEQCRQLRRHIRETEDRAALVSLWREGIVPLLISLHALQDSSNEKAWGAHVALKNALAKLLGEAGAGAFISVVSASAEHLASLGPFVGIGMVARGEMTRENYISHYGHRDPYENYLEYPRPMEDPGWLDAQLADYEKSPVNVEALLAKRRADFEDAWEDFQMRHPKQVKSVRQKIERVTGAAHEREAVRTELTRTLGVMREWFLRVGELTGLGDDVFFLTYEELAGVLAGDDSATTHIPPRREAYEKYSALPPYPPYIRGRFDPFQWAADPDRRNDIYDPHAPVSRVDSTTIKGYAGSAGRVEGMVRKIDRPEEGDQLQPGEILVATTTNVGWTPIFPRAAAVITDIGAPLSHAAIVARELGIPAVVGCVDATTRLKTGDRVRVDGGQGLVHILEKVN